MGHGVFYLARQIIRNVYQSWPADVAVKKEYNLRRHFEMKHQDGYKHLDMKQKLQTVEELKRRLVSQQTVLGKS